MLDLAVGSTANVTNGNLYHDQTLFSVPDAKILVSFALSYNSTDGYNGVLGKGWTHSYNKRIVANSDGTYTLVGGDGSKTVLYQNGAYYTSSVSTYPALSVNTGGTYTLHYKDGTLNNFDSNGRLSAIVDRNSNTMTFGYDLNGNMASITDPAGRATTLTYTLGKIVSITDAKGNTYSFTYTNDLLTGIAVPTPSGAGNWTYAYDSYGFMLSKTDPQGHITSYLYDANHKLVQSTDPEGRTRSLSYPTGGTGNIRTTSFTEKDGGVWSYTYDINAGVLTEKTDPNGSTTRYTYDSFRNILSETDPQNHTTTYTYDAYNNMTSRTDALNRTTSYVYNTFGEVTSVTDPQAKITTLTYDSKGNLVSTTDPLSAVTQFQYDQKGNLTRIIDAANHSTTLAYDASNNLITVTDPANAVTSFTYDAAGNVLTSTDATNATTTFAYDSLGNLITITGPNNAATHFNYDAGGRRVSMTDANGKVTSYTYNPGGQLASQTDALGNVTTFSYGATGCGSCGGGGDRLTALRDSRNNATSFIYDKLGKVLSETDPLNNVTSFTYDSRGNLISKTDANNAATSYSYDAVGRLTGKTYPDTSTVTFQYDSKDRVTNASNANIAYNFTYDDNGRVTGVTDSNGRTISYAYDSLGNRTQMTMPGGSSVQYTYDQNNRLTQILPTGGQPFAFTYDANGRRKTLAYPNGATATYTYDTRGGLTGLVYKTSSNATIDSFAYTLEATGNRVARADNEYQYSYAYDATYRVTQCLPSRTVTTPLFQQYTENFTYDSVGNRLTGQRYGASVHSQDYTYDYENRLVRVVKHLASGTDTITFKYDPFGRRIEKNVSTVENSVPTTYKYTYVYDNEDIILEVLDKTQNAVTTTTTTSYVHGPGVDEPLSLARNGQTYYYHADGLGSITSMTDSTQAVVNRYSYDSFGNVQRSETVWNDFTYTGREYDFETGLLFLRARYYDPETGRFVSKDPIGFAGGDVNVYNYVGNNPIGFIDPFGLRSLSPREIVLLHDVFGNNIDVNVIDLSNTSGERGYSVYGNNIHLPKNYFEDKNCAKEIDFTDSVVISKFVHEALHVWQRQHGDYVTTWSIWPQIKYSLLNISPYKYEDSNPITDADKLLEVFKQGSYEQQGQIIEDYARQNRQGENNTDRYKDVLDYIKRRPMP